MQVIPNPNPPRILIADNDPTTLETLTEYFQQRGNIVFPAPNLEATETALKLNREELDAAILDGRLTYDDDEKDGSGWELAEKTSDEDNNLLIFVHSRVPPKASPFAGRRSEQSEGRPNLFEIPKSEGIASLGKSVDEEIKKKRERKQQQASQDALRPDEMTTVAVAPFWTKQSKALVALIALLLTLVFGLGAVLISEPKLLVAAVAGAIVAVVFITWTLD